MQHKETPANPLAGVEDLLELGGLEQPMAARKAGNDVHAKPISGRVPALCGRSLPHPDGLGDKTLTAFGATSIDDLAAVGSGHTGAETVGTGALEVTGLESALHGCT